MLRPAWVRLCPEGGVNPPLYAESVHMSRTARAQLTYDGVRADPSIKRGVVRAARAGRAPPG